MSEAWPAQVVQKTGVVESDAAAEASHVAGKASDAVKGAAHAVQGAVIGVRQPPPPPTPPKHSKPISPPTLSFVLPCNLQVFPLTRAATTQLGLSSAVSGCIHYHSLQAQTGKACSHDQLHVAGLAVPNDSLRVAYSLTTACGSLEPHTLCPD